MKVRKMLFTLLALLLALAVLGACTPAATEAPPVDEPVVEQPTVEEPAADVPTELKLAIITCCGIESMWDASFFESLERVKAEKPHGLNITWDWTDFVDHVYGEGLVVDAGSL